MNKIVASVGLVALGASGVQAASPSPFNTDSAKPWTISATLRGFYDDNYQTVGNDVTIPPGQHRGSFGFDVSPSANFEWQLEQTQIALGYTYGFKYYDHPFSDSDKHYDQTHSFLASLDHSFNERYQISVTDSFVIGQEPDVLRAGNTFSTFQRIPGDNIRNYGSITFNAQLTRQIGLQVGYANSYYDYSDETVTLNTSAPAPGLPAAAPRCGRSEVCPSFWWRSSCPPEGWLATRVAARRRQGCTTPPGPGHLPRGPCHRAATWPSYRRHRQV
jgi:hypothetical protein